MSETVNFVCAIGGQHDGHLPFWLPGFVKFIMLKLYVFVCVAEINILLRLGLSSDLARFTITISVNKMCGSL